MVQVKSHAKPVAKGKEKKKERASRSLLSSVPGTLVDRYLVDFQPSFVHTSIAISSNPWNKLSIDDAQELFTAVFPDVTHEISFGDVFYAPVKFVWFVRSPYSDEFQGKSNDQHDSEPP